MDEGRAQLIWIGNGGIGKVRTLYFSPWLLRVLLFLLIGCVAAVPLLETGILHLAEQVARLDARKQSLEAEVRRLAFVGDRLQWLEQKDTVLRAYFGMDQVENLGQSALGGGAPRPLDGDSAAGAQAGGGHSLAARLRRLDVNSQVLDGLLVRQGEMWRHTPSIVPTDIPSPQISSGFGWRTNPFTERQEFHAGIDIVGHRGQAVIAPAAGTVTTIGYDGWLGHHVVIRHTDTLKTVYGHLDKIEVARGDRLQRGDRIGQMGNSGLSTSHHLHYTVLRGDRPVDPMQYILNATAPIR